MPRPAFLTFATALCLTAATALAQDAPPADAPAVSDETLVLPPVADATNFVPLLAPLVAAGAVAAAAAGGSGSTPATPSTN